MTNNLELERYLNTLEIELSRVSAAKKAEIILEVKGNIESKLEAGETFESTVKTMGSASQVGQKYLRSLGYVKKKEKSSFLKWFFLFSIGFVLLLFLGVGVLAWKFSPLISVDEKIGRFQFLGGLVDIQANQDGSFFAITPESTEFSGTASMKNINEIDIDIKNGYLELTTHESEQFDYSCRADEDLSHLFLEKAGKYTIHLEDKGISCQLKIPKGSSVKMKLVSGRVKFEDYSAGVDAEIKNGSISFIANKADKYSYNLSVDKGTIGAFENSDEQGAYKIKLKVVNGLISNK